MAAKYKLNSKKQIIKTDFEERYNPQDFPSTIKRAEQKLKELKAQKDVYTAKCDNVANHYPQVLKVKEEDKNAIWLYHENFVAAKQVESQIKMIEKDLKQLKKEMKEIEKQTGIDFENL